MCPNMLWTLAHPSFLSGVEQGQPWTGQWTLALVDGAGLTGIPDGRLEVVGAVWEAISTSGVASVWPAVEAVAGAAFFAGLGSWCGGGGGGMVVRPVVGTLTLEVVGACGTGAWHGVPAAGETVPGLGALPEAVEGVDCASCC